MPFDRSRLISAVFAFSVVSAVVFSGLLGLHHYLARDILLSKTRYEMTRIQSHLACSAPTSWQNLPPSKPLSKIMRAETRCATLYRVTTHEGYNGEIELLLVWEENHLSGVDILLEHETPGIGARIDPEHSDWLKNWLKRYQNGARDFDGISGATISSGAVHRALMHALSLREKDTLKPPKTP